MPYADCLQTKSAADFTKLRISRTKTHFFLKDMYLSDLQLRTLEHCRTCVEFEQVLGIFTDSKLHFYHAIYIFSHFIQFLVLVYEIKFYFSSLQYLVMFCPRPHSYWQCVSIASDTKQLERILQKFSVICLIFFLLSRFCSNAQALEK
jgi:hypothetical protein